MRRVLVTGAGGQVGWSLLRATPPDGLDVRGYPSTGLDIVDAEAVERVVNDTDLVVNAAAYTAVDAAETDSDRAFAANARGPELLARRCAKLGVPLIHLSSDYVFDGDKPDPYDENDPVNPLNTYGRSKAAGEEAVRHALDTHIILRTSWAYASHGRNFVRTMVDLHDSVDPVRVVDDQIGAPTSSIDIAAAVLVVAAKLLDRRGPYGTFHYTALGSTSWFGLADEVFNLIEQRGVRRPVLEPIGSVAYVTPAARPKNSRLDCSKIMEDFAPPRRPWQEGVAEAVGAMLDADQQGLTP